MIQHEIIEIWASEVFQLMSVFSKLVWLSLCKLSFSSLNQPANLCSHYGSVASVALW
jgi:hypothetical protein